MNYLLFLSKCIWMLLHLTVKLEFTRRFSFVNLSFVWTGPSSPITMDLRSYDHSHDGSCNPSSISWERFPKLLLQFFSVALVQFSDQNWNSQTVQSSHHCVPGAHQKSSFSFILNKLQMLWYIHLLFPTLSIAYHVDQNVL